LQIIFSQIKWIMIVSGAITCSMLLATFSPELNLKLTFGSNVEGELAVMIVRNWGALIALVGAMLIYGAYSQANRSLALVVASISKSAFVALNLIYGQAYLSVSLPALVFDSILVVLFLSYLVWERKGGK
jgi:hypothetical protein